MQGHKAYYGLINNYAMRSLKEMQNNLRIIGKIRGQSINEVKERIVKGREFLVTHPDDSDALNLLSILEEQLERKTKYQSKEVEGIPKQEIDQFFIDLAKT